MPLSDSSDRSVGSRHATATASIATALIAIALVAAALVAISIIWDVARPICRVLTGIRIRIEIGALCGWSNGNRPEQSP